MQPVLVTAPIDVESNPAGSLSAIDPGATARYDFW